MAVFTRKKIRRDTDPTSFRLSEATVSAIVQIEQLYRGAKAAPLNVAGEIILEAAIRVAIRHLPDVVREVEQIVEDMVKDGGKEQKPAA